MKIGILRVVFVQVVSCLPNIQLAFHMTEITKGLNRKAEKDPCRVVGGEKRYLSS